MNRYTRRRRRCEGTRWHSRRGSLAPLAAVALQPTAANGAPPTVMLRISAQKPVAPEKIELAVLCDAQKPILVHFESGADRTGCVATLYRYAMAGENAEPAACKLSLCHGHFPYLTSKSTMMNESARIYSASHVPAVPSSAAVVP